METVLYIGTDRGVVTTRCRDESSWQIVAQGLENWSITEIVASPDSPNKVFAATRGDGVWSSEDFGKTWKKPCYGKRGPDKVKSLTLDPHDPARLYAGCEPIDVWVSEDEGRNWVRFDSIWDIPFVATIPYPLTTVEPHVRDVTVDPTDPNVIYAALQIGFIVKSTNAGKSWTLLNRDIDCDVHTIEIDPTNPRRIYVATGGHDARHGTAPGRALYVSEDAGENWAPMAMNFTQEYAVPLTLDPADPSRLYSAVANGQPGQWMRRASGAESTLIRSRNSGKTWERLDHCADSPDFPEVLLVDRTRTHRLYATYHKGDIYASDDGGDSWVPMQVSVTNVLSASLAHA